MQNVLMLFGEMILLITASIQLFANVTPSATISTAACGGSRERLLGQPSEFSRAAQGPPKIQATATRSLRATFLGEEGLKSPIGNSVFSWFGEI